MKTTYHSRFADDFSEATAILTFTLHTKTFKIDCDNVQERLDFRNPDLTIHELIEMHEQDIKELVSVDPVRSE
ncbi:hypothetical protein TNCV_3993281 [Trichonephila clavipes]|uniref:Uncharacterized protein n=1 Tax=Trichonephila clavipes TaxID=2585209 RepID=A0A8X6SWF3_TRICX|nr:hypothetical protein TNCV_3993281 [Trichonephila clavipes]